MLSAKTAPGRRVRRSAARGRAGEKAAAALLRAAGYRVLDTQLTRRWTLWVDGREREITARADFLVERGGRRFVADAKTGEQAKVTGRATRRQLLEYRHAYAVDGVLLVDAEAGRIVEVGFGLMADPAPSRLRPMLVVAALAFAAGAAAATWLLRG